MLLSVAMATSDLVVIDWTGSKLTRFSFGREMNTGDRASGTMETIGQTIGLRGVTTEGEHSRVMMAASNGCVSPTLLWKAPNGRGGYGAILEQTMEDEPRK